DRRRPERVGMGWTRDGVASYASAAQAPFLRGPALSAFLQNHPLPLHFVRDIVFDVTLVLVCFAFTTYIAMVRVRRPAWPAAGRPRWRWLLIAGIGVFVPPVGAVTGIVWRARIQPELLAHSPGPAAGGDPYRLFGAASTFTGRAARVAVASIAAITVI